MRHWAFLSFAVLTGGIYVGSARRKAFDKEFLEAAKAKGLVSCCIVEVLVAL